LFSDSLFLIYKQQHYTNFDFYLYNNYIKSFAKRRFKFEIKILRNRVRYGLRNALSLHQLIKKKKKKKNIKFGWFYWAISLVPYFWGQNGIGSGCHNILIAYRKCSSHFILNWQTTVETNNYNWVMRKGKSDNLIDLVHHFIDIEADTVLIIMVN